MAATNINRVMVTGNLTADPELRPLPSGTSVGRLRLACNTRRKNGSTGEWEDKPNYFNVTVWGAQAENAPIPLEGTSRGDRRTAQVARVGKPPGAGQSARQPISLPIRCSSSAPAMRPQVADSRRATELHRAATSRSTSGTSSPHLSPADPATTTFRSSFSKQGSNQWQKRAVAASLFAAETRRVGPEAAGASHASIAATRSSRSTTRTSPRCRSSSPRRARSARGGSPARAGAIRTRSPRAVKRARELALLPYVNEGGREDSPRGGRGDRDRDRER